MDQKKLSTSSRLAGGDIEQQQEENYERKNIFGLKTYRVKPSRKAITLLEGGDVRKPYVRPNGK